MVPYAAPAPAPAVPQAPTLITNVLINGVPAHGARSLTIPDATLMVDATGTLMVMSPTVDAGALPTAPANARVPSVFLNGKPMPATPGNFSGVVVVDANGTFIMTRMGR